MKLFKSFIISLPVLFCLIISSNSVAAVIFTDDANFGLNTVLRDTDNSLEFLRLDLTMGYSYNGILAESGVGQVFDSWSVASEANMDSLGVSLGLTHGSSDLTQIALAESIRDWFCPAITCVNLSSTHEYTRGLVSDAGGPGGAYLLAFSLGRRFNVTPEEVDYRVSGYGDYNSKNEEVWMVRTAQAVPEPSTIWLLTFALGGLGLVKRKSLKK